MKHSFKMTMQVLVWLLFAVGLGFVLMPFAQENRMRLVIDPVVFFVTIVVMLAVGAVIWFFMMRKVNERYIDYLMAISIGVVSSRFLAFVVPVFSDKGWLGFALRFVVYVVMFLLYLRLLDYMRICWQNTLDAAFYSNLIMMIVFSSVGVMIGASLGIWLMMALLLLVSLYDMWAVWKSKHMVSMAKFFMSRRIFPGIAIPYRNSVQFAVLGGGDIVFIIAACAAIYSTSISMALAAGIGMLFSISALFVFSSPKRFYPAMPAVFIGCVLGIGIWVLVKALLPCAASAVVCP